MWWDSSFTNPSVARPQMDITRFWLLCVTAGWIGHPNRSGSREHRLRRVILRTPASPSAADERTTCGFSAPEHGSSLGASFR